MKLRQSSILISSSGKPTGVQRWDGGGRRSTEWDGLRRDAELWIPNGDCFIHLYERGHSRRGPSFCVPMDVLKNATCGNLFTLCFAHTVLRSDIPVSQLSALKDAPDQMYELYIPAPEDFLREDAFQWHLTTRNFFAFIFNKPLVGTHLSTALIGLQERLQLFRSAEPSQNQAALMKYANEVGYLNFTHRPDNALALLHYAEHYELKDLWVDAYAHCVGMNETLYLSAEYDPIPRVTKALITRAHLEMDLHIGRVSRAVSNFLEGELSPSNLGLPQGPRAHLERFRSFLHSFYVDKFGYWPPPKGANFSRDLCCSMYYDFRALYDFLVDSDSSDCIQTQKPADGGICVLQNVQAFDRRHKYTPLLHPLPLLPAVSPPTTRIQAQKNLVAMKLGHKHTKTDKQLLALATLTAATNSKKTTIANAPLVRAYKAFERDSTEKQKEKVSMSDARKVRWILIYGTLQMLITVTRAPPEVRETDGVHYPLCCLTAGTPPWKNKPAEDSAPASDSGYASAEVDMHAQTFVKLSSATAAKEITYSIRPDCEASDYITHTNHQDAPRLSRRASVLLGVEVPAPLRVTTCTTTSSPVRSSSRRHSSVPPLSRTASWKSSLGRSLSPFASRRNSIRIQPQPWCEIQVPGYGNGLNETILDPPSQAATTPSSPVDTTGSKLRAMRRTSLPTKLTVKTSFSGHPSSFSPSTEPIVEADERRTSTTEALIFAAPKRSVTAPLTTLFTEPSSALDCSATQKIVSSRPSKYFHTRNISEEPSNADSTAASSAMRRSTSCESAQSSTHDSAAWSPAISGSTATSITSTPPSPLPGGDCDVASDALARTEQLMAELDLEATENHVLRRSTSRYMDHARSGSSVYSASIYDEFATAPASPYVSRPGTSMSSDSKARRVMGMPEGVGMADCSMAARNRREVMSMYQELAGQLWSP